MKKHLAPFFSPPCCSGPWRRQGRAVANPEANCSTDYRDNTRKLLLSSV